MNELFGTGNVTPQEVKRFLFRLMLALWLLSMVVLINAYIGTYTANMAVPKLEPTVDTLEELAASQKFKMTVELNSDLSYKVLVSILSLSVRKENYDFLKKITYRVLHLDRLKFWEILSESIRNCYSRMLWMLC